MESMHQRNLSLLMTLLGHLNLFTWQKKSACEPEIDGGVPCDVSIVARENEHLNVRQAEGWGEWSRDRRLHQTWMVAIPAFTIGLATAATHGGMKREIPKAKCTY